MDDGDGLELLLNDDEAGVLSVPGSRTQMQCRRNMLLLAAEDASPVSSPVMTSSVLMANGDHDMDYLFGADEVADLHGLEEVSVDSEDDDAVSEASSQYGEIVSYLSIFDILSKVPEDRSPSDIDMVLEYIQHLPAFSNMSMSVRRKLCGVMTLETVREASTVIVRSGEEVDSWWVVFGGSVELVREGHDPCPVHLGECFGIARGAPKRRYIQTGTLQTRGPETILLRVLAEKFHKILSQLEEETIKVEEGGKVVLVTEFSEEVGSRIAVRGTAEKLLTQLLRDDEHPLFSEDLLLGYRTFMQALDVANQLADWFENRLDCRQKVARLILLWVNNHIDDFDGKEDMIAFLESFQSQLQEANMFGEFRLLTIALQRRPTIVLGRENRQASPIPNNCRPISESEASKPPSPRVSGRRGFNLPFAKLKSKTSIDRMRKSFRSNNVVSEATIVQQPTPLVATSLPCLSPLSSHISPTESAPSVGPSITLRAVDSVPLTLSPTTPMSIESGTVLKVYRHDHTFRYVLVSSDTSADTLVRLAHRQFDMTDSVDSYSLCRLSVSPEGIVKQTRLPGMYHNLPSHLSLTARYYLKSNATTTNLVHGEQVQEMLQEGATDLLSFDPKDVARAVTLQDFAIFCQITPVEYIEDLWSLPHSSLNDSLQRFSETTNREMFWVATEILKEPVLTQRVRLIKLFIKIAKFCRKARNYNTMFAITSGLSYGAVTRLRLTWERVGSRQIKVVEEMQQLMNPSKNMMNYRHLITGARSPMIPFFPVVKKDVTFMFLGNDNKVDGLVNFEKLRMISKEIRTFCNYHKNNYVPSAMFGSQGNMQNVPSPRPSRAVQNEQWLTQRRIDHYLANLDVITDENVLKSMAEKLVEGEQS